MCTKVDTNLYLRQLSWSYDIRITKEGKHPAYMSMTMTDNNLHLYDLSQYEPSGAYIANHAYKGFLRAMIAAKKKKYKFRILKKRVMIKPFNVCNGQFRILEKRIMVTHFNVRNGRFYLNTDGKINTYSFPFQTSVR